MVVQQPLGMLRDPAVVARLKKDLGGRTMIIVGKNDELDLFPSAQEVSKN